MRLWGNRNKLFHSFSLDNCVPADPLLLGIDRGFDLGDLRANTTLPFSLAREPCARSPDFFFATARGPSTTRGQGSHRIIAGGVTTDLSATTEYTSLFTTERTTHE